MNMNWDEFSRLSSSEIDGSIRVKFCCLLNMFCWKNIVLFSLFVMNLVEQPAPEVRVEQGVVSGKVNSDGTIYEYVGIPYATVGKRFQAPLPPPKWDGVYQAIYEHYQCPQAFSPGIIGTEDCLKINVYVPTSNIRSKHALPVMVYFHGGGFVIGSGGKLIYSPDFLVKHEVIVVTFNYRLGALGFLCLGTKEAPGNAGLKDQVAALRWVKKNIAGFNGDPDNVTIFGHSAGAASVSLLIASEVTDGLFHRAIIQSGTGISFWTSMPPGVIAKSVAKYLGYDTENLNELYDIFVKMPLEEILMKSLGEPIIELMYSNIIHLPCIENNIPGEEAVISDLPYNLLINNPKNISVIYGITDNEGLYLISEETDQSLYKLNYKKYPFPDLEFSSPQEALALSRKIKNYYFGNQIIRHETLTNLSNLYGDVYLTVPTLMESEILVNQSQASIYNYYFRYTGGRNMIKATFCKKNSDALGASHGDDILYLFKSYVWPYPIKAKDQKVVDWITKMWTNFAKFGDPTPPSDKDIPVKWKPSTKESQTFLYIDENLRMGPLPHPERYNFWKDVYQKYRKTKF